MHLHVAKGNGEAKMWHEFFQSQFIGKGTSIHWPDLDEDLSLKGFLKNERKLEN